MQTLQKRIRVIVGGEYNTTSVRRLIVSFSFSVLAWNSFVLLRDNSGACASQDIFISYEYDLIDKAFNNALTLSAQLNASVVIVIANGAVAPKFVEVTYEYVTRNRVQIGNEMSRSGAVIGPRYEYVKGKTIKLKDMAPGTGLCITPCTQKIIKISLEGTLDITPA
jgi:hypothetical protein